MLFRSARFSVVLLLASGVWVPSLLVFVLLTAVPLSDSSSAGGLASELFFAFLFLGIALGRLIGNADAANHREMLTVACGGVKRLHRGRSVAALGVGLVLVVVVSALAFGSVANDRAQGVALTLTTALSGTLIGLGGGAFLQPPLVKRRQTALLMSVLFIVVVILLPPLQDVLREMSVGPAKPPFGLLAASAAWFVTTHELASRITAR